MSVRGAIVAAAFVAALGVGIVEFPHALEPGAAERDGVVLNMLLDRGSGPTPNDWYRATSTPIRASGDRIVASTPVTQRLIVSRILPVFPHECYEVSVTGATTRSGAALVAFDAEVTRFSGFVRLPAGRPRRVSFRFETRDRELTLSVAARIGARVVLDAVSLERQGDRSCPRPRVRHDIAELFRPSP